MVGMKMENDYNYDETFTEINFLPLAIFASFFVWCVCVLYGLPHYLHFSRQHYGMKKNRRHFCFETFNCVCRFCVGAVGWATLSKRNLRLAE
jgi:hypothetical protein